MHPLCLSLSPPLCLVASGRYGQRWGRWSSATCHQGSTEDIWWPATWPATTWHDDLIYGALRHIHQYTYSWSTWGTQAFHSFKPGKKCLPSWWYQGLEILSASLAICGGNTLVTSGFPSLTKAQWYKALLAVFFVVSLNKLLKKQSGGQWSETSCQSCDVTVMLVFFFICNPCSCGSYWP